MTTAAMVVGMIPLALGIGEGAEQQAPMAHAIIGGVITSTLLTLIVVPVIYTYLDDLKVTFFKLMGKKKTVSNEPLVLIRQPRAEHYPCCDERHCQCGDHQSMTDKDIT